MKNTIKIFCLFCLLFLMLYQDFPLINVFGEIARSPIPFLAPFFILYIFSQRNIIISKNAKYLLYYIFYLVLISIFFIGNIYFKEADFNVLGENIIIKSSKMLVYPSMGLIFYVFIYSILRNTKNIESLLFEALKYLQLFYCLFLMIEVYFLKKATIFLPFLHSSSGKYWRVRLLTVEESWTGTILIFLVFFPIWLAFRLNKSSKEKRLIYACSFIILILYSIVSESKGFLFLILISIIPLFIKAIFQNNYFKKIAVIIIPIVSCLGIGIALVLFNIIQEQFFTSITFGTRLISILSAIEVFIYHPFGVGWSGMVYYFPKAIQDIIDLGWIDSFNQLEIKSYITNTKALSTKSEFFDHLMYGGIIFLVFYYLFFLKSYFLLLKTTSNFWLKILVIYLILAGVVYITYHIKYEVWFVFAFVEYILNKKLPQDEKNISSL